MNFLGITWHESMEESLDRNWQDNIKENILIHLIQFQVTYKSFFIQPYYSLVAFWY